MPKDPSGLGKKEVDKDKEMQALMKQKAKRRQILREYFQKQVSDPFRHIRGDGGALYDPAILRYHAMKNNFFPFFKPNFRNVLQGLLFMIVPMVTFGYFMYQDKTKLERSFRSGEVAYKDRRFKFI